jgi:hypothetical protein
MGCDIHTFIEYSTFTDKNGEAYWQCMGGRYNPGRDYTMFGIMAGVRDDSEQMFEPRGLPDGKLSYQVEDYVRMRIADEGSEPSDDEVTLEQARSWTTGHYGETITNDAQGKPRWVTNPDLHSHSWLTLDEYRQVLNRYKFGEVTDELDEIDVADEDKEVVTQAVAALRGGGGREYDVGWGAILAAMEYFAARGCQTRLVFCFDN